MNILRDKKKKKKKQKRGKYHIYLSNEKPNNAYTGCSKTVNDYFFKIIIMIIIEKLIVDIVKEQAQINIYSRNMK